MSDCKNINPLQRTGTSQYKRVLQALLPDSAKTDERTYADLILFAREYASYLNYYDRTVKINDKPENQINGDWQPLMKMDISVTLAGLALENVKDYFDYIKYCYDSVLKATTLPAQQGYYTSLLNFLISLVHHLDEEGSQLPADFAFSTWLHISIKSRLLDNYVRLMAYHEESVVNGMIDPAVTFFGDQPPYPIRKIADLKTIPLSQIDWPLPGILPVVPIEGTTPGDMIRNTVTHGLFTGTIENLLKGYAAIVNTSAKYLDQTLQSFPTHSPHYALYISFIKLFRVAQNRLNDFTDRHLKFYYQDVLRLHTHPAVPDQVYLIFELQKNINQHLLTQGSLFKGGKDAQARDKIYSLTGDLVINQGIVTSIQSVLRPPDASGDPTLRPLLAAPVTNSADGTGKPLKTTDKSWFPFGDPEVIQEGTIGFSIAHPMFFLKEGVRFIWLGLALSNTTALSSINLTQEFSIRITGEKGWYTIAPLAVFLLSNTLDFFIVLPQDAPAFISYDEKIHAAGYNVSLPVMEILVHNQSGQKNYIDLLGSQVISSAFVYVGVQGIKDLSIQNEVGSMDPSKPFQLFGPAPHIDSEFIIGSNEIFLKNQFAKVSATATIQWDKTDQLVYDSSSSSSNYQLFTEKKIGIEYLQDGIWQPAAEEATQKLLAHVHTPYLGLTLHTPPEQTIDLILPKFTSAVDFGANPPYSIVSKNGFMKIYFQGPTDFGHNDYIKRFMQATLQGSGAIIPDEPYTPTVKSMSVNYWATAFIDLNISDPAQMTDQNGYFYHLIPFGHALQHKSFLGATASIPLLAPFLNEGELYIGIDQFNPDQSLSLLFKVSEGSADPNLNEQTVTWSYLALNNQWIAFDTNSLIDGTNNLTRTGIIQFPFPDDATATNSLMSKQLFWIRGTVQKDTAAICHIISVQAQAATAILTDFYQAGVGFTDVLPASTISKMLVSDSSIKTISQPYASFGGKVAESDPDFYTRISERLRHKNRSITIWDYERMVLKQFPQIYKVKCINHTKIGSTIGSGDNEFAPGYVLVVPIPDLTGLNAIDPLRPQTPLGTIVEITKYLQTLISPFVRLQVKNPRFDEIQLDFKVKFFDPNGAFYHDQLISDLEEYMSPWAFGGSQEIEFGGKISKSVLLNFIEHRSYVDYITCFKMYLIVDGIKSGDLEEAEASSSRSVMVSYKGDPKNGIPKHYIDFTNPDCNC